MHDSWKTLFLENASTLVNISEALDPIKDTVAPAPSDGFRAFKLCPLDKVKVVILGQEPYPNRDHANGLAFSVNKGVKIPGSLRNIYTEIESNFDYKMDYDNGDLTPWAEQGVLLLNTCLTSVIGGDRMAHYQLWHPFVKAVLRAVSERDNIFYMLWGNYAHEFVMSSCYNIFETSRVVVAGHPSPNNTSGNKFLGCSHFKQCNDYLEKQKVNPINWKI